MNELKLNYLFFFEYPGCSNEFWGVFKRYDEKKGKIVYDTFDQINLEIEIDTPTFLKRKDYIEHMSKKYPSRNYKELPDDNCVMRMGKSDGLVDVYDWQKEIKP